MSKISTTRLPNATPEYNQTQFDVLIRLLEQVIQQKLQRITTGYETHINNMMQALEVELELCIKTENCLLRGGISSDNNCNNSLLWIKLCFYKEK